MNKSSIKSKDLHRHREKEEYSNIQWIKDGSPFSQQGQNLGQSSETLPLLIAIMELHLSPALNLKIQLKPKLK